MQLNGYIVDEAIAICTHTTCPCFFTTTSTTCYRAPVVTVTNKISCSKSNDCVFCSTNEMDFIYQKLNNTRLPQPPTQLKHTLPINHKILILLVSKTNWAKTTCKMLTGLE
jgi:hypothetical protein